MRIRNLFISALVLLAVGAGTVLAVPVELYLVKFAPGTDVYRLAGSQSWPLYHISGQQALMGKWLSISGNKAVLGSNLVYQGPSENLRWVHLKRNSQLPAIKAVYSGKDILLAEAGNVAAAGVKNGRDLMIKAFNPRSIVMAPPAVLRTASLTRDTTVATLVHLVDTAEVRTRIEAMQSFDTRFLDAANHDSVVGWIRNQFLNMGIADVRTDTFDIGYGMKQHNIIATIPGLLDTTVVYIVGGHYDSYSPDEYNQAPGADDNASGTVAALEMARVLSLPGNQPNNTIRFIAFDAEEYGLFGSAEYAQAALNAGMDIGCMLNYDMIGYKGNDSTFVSKLNPGSESYAYMLGQMAGWYGRLADTNLVPEYNSVYLSGSDSYEFSIRGFPVTYSEELDFSTVYHQTNDSTTYMSMRYATSIIKAGMGLLGTLANYPQKVGGLEVTDVGNGTQLYVQLLPNKASNITGYKVYWSNNSGNKTYNLPIFTNNKTTGPSVTIGGLMADSLYYIGVTAIDNDGKESPMITEATGTPRSAPLAPSGLVAVPVDSGITLTWDKNLELDLAGYNVFRRIDSGTFDSLTFTSDTFLLEKPLSGASRYYYKIRARDTDANAGLLSDSAYCRPITLDQGILVVDETQNWTTTSFPRDVQQDSFYNYLTTGYKSEGYDFGAVAQKPILGDMGPYSTVLWHSDDPSSFLAANDSSAIREYLMHGGKLWFTGWKPSADIRNSATYPANFAAGNLFYDYFGISRVELSGSTDSLIGVQGLSGYPSIALDPAKYPNTLYNGTMKNIEACTPLAGADTIYVMDMRNNASPYEGRACAVRDSGKTVFFGFPLYYMDKNQARLAAQKVMAEFGEVPLGVAGKPENFERITDRRLLQNSPNPFSQQTNISYQLPKADKVKLNIYNIAGQLVKTLVNGEQQSGSYTVKWDRKDNQNRQVSAGVYIYHLSTDGKTQSRKMIVLK
ncbi:MAG: M28 family peptidase [bacterium]|nr:M28 family peptidase [bacterium]